MPRECFCQLGHGHIKEYYKANKNHSCKGFNDMGKCLWYNGKWKGGVIACKLQSPLHIITEERPQEM